MAAHRLLVARELLVQATELSLDQRVRIGGDLQLLVGEEKQSALFRPQPTEAIAVRLGL